MRGPGLHGEHAGLGVRGAAFLLNGLIVGVPVAIANAALRASLPTEFEPCQVDGQRGVCEVLTGAGETAYWLVTVAVSIAVLVGYYGYFEGVQGATPGKRAMGLRVVDCIDGQPIGLRRAVGRELFKVISAAVLLLGFLWVLWDRERRGWHDLAANSVVIVNPQVAATAERRTAV